VPLTRNPVGLESGFDWLVITSTAAPRRTPADHHRQPHLHDRRSSDGPCAVSGDLSRAARPPAS
jgi:hypothetical protein